MRKRSLIILLFCAVCCFTATQAQIPPVTQVYELIDLNHPGLEKVKAAYNKGNIKQADKELLKYFRNRKGITLTEIDPAKAKNSQSEQTRADESLEHKFYAHKGYEPYFYGKDIDWRFWPVKDNELRWQLHRHYWFIPLAKAYSATQDIKYIDAWMEHYTDWVKKNPIAGKDSSPADKENTRFAWRPLEVSTRLQDQLVSFVLTKDSPYITPEFFNMFMAMYHKHADYILNHYSAQGNHLLFEAQRMVYAGTFFPEFKDARKWRESGIEILNREINIQVYDDGMQFELDPGYHVAAIGIFLKALGMAKANGMENEFPASYIAKIESMTEATYNLLYPDYASPIFGDARLSQKETVARQFSSWLTTFPDNKQVAYFASQGRKGVAPPYTTNALLNSGFFIFRSGWQDDATVMIVKANPPAFWHNQPDNGTFELWRKGRNFFPDSGSYVYAGDEQVQKERDWFRQTRVHNTLTLDNKNIENTDSKTLFWGKDGNADVLVTENQSYKDLTHRRSVFFVDNEFFVIVDEAYGTATGNVAIHYALCESDINVDIPNATLKTTFKDGNNLRLCVLSGGGVAINKEEGWVSRQYREKNERPAYAFSKDKTSDENILFITVIVPDDGKYQGQIKASLAKSENGKTFNISIANKNYELKYRLL